MRKNYNKLVRDQIPQIIRSEGRACASETMDSDEYRRALLEKLVEEANEVANATSETLATELADVLEVIDTVIKVYGFSPEEIKSMQMERRIKRGSFEKKLKLIWTD